MSARFCWLTPVLVLALVFSFLGSCIAHAQVVQPTYIRPSKGSKIQVFSGTAPIAFANSAVYDFTAFSAVQITVVSDGSDFGNCTTNPRIVTNGSLAKDSGFTLIRSENTDFQTYLFSTAISPTSSSITYSVNSVRPYVQFAWQRFARIGGFVPCTFTVTMTPLPLQTATPIMAPFAGPVFAMTTLAIPMFPANVSLGTLFTETLNVIDTRIQNIGVNPVLCRYAGAPSAAVNNFVLAADTGAASGNGGVLSLPTPNATPAYVCTATGGVSTLSLIISTAAPQ